MNDKADLSYNWYERLHNRQVDVRRVVPIYCIERGLVERVHPSQRAR